MFEWSGMGTVEGCLGMKTVYLLQANKTRLVLERGRGDYREDGLLPVLEGGNRSLNE